MNKTQVLVVEDDSPIRNLITTTLKTNNYRYLTAVNGESAISQTASHLSLIHISEPTRP